MNWLVMTAILVALAMGCRSLLRTMKDQDKRGHPPWGNGPRRNM